MTIDEFCTVLDELTGIPCRHYEFSEPTPAPCLVYYELDGESIHADSVNVYDEVYIRVELYVKPTDNASAAALEEFAHRKRALLRSGAVVGE